MGLFKTGQKDVWIERVIITKLVLKVA